MFTSFLRTSDSLGAFGLIFQGLIATSSGEAVSVLRIAVDLAATDGGLRAQYVKPDPQ